MIDVDLFFICSTVIWLIFTLFLIVKKGVLLTMLAAIVLWFLVVTELWWYSKLQSVVIKDIVLYVVFGFFFNWIERIIYTSSIATRLNEEKGKYVCIHPNKISPPTSESHIYANSYEYFLQRVLHLNREKILCQGIYFYSNYDASSYTVRSVQVPQIDKWTTEYRLAVVKISQMVPNSIMTIVFWPVWIPVLYIYIKLEKISKTGKVDFEKLFFLGRLIKKINSWFEPIIATKD